MNKFVELIKQLKLTVNEIKLLFSIKKTTLFWGMYVIFSSTLLIHTVWWFGMAEPEHTKILSWSLAVVVEIAIIGFTHSAVDCYVRGRKDMIYFVSIGGLFIATSTSSLANYSHAVEFSRYMKVFEVNPYITPSVYHFASGAALPIMAFIFSVVLANSSASEQRGEWEIKYDKLKQEFNQAKTKLANQKETLALNINSLAEKDAEIKNVEIKLISYQSFEELLKKVSFRDIEKLFKSETKTDRIDAVKKLWPSASPKTIMELSGASASLVSSRNGIK